VNKTTIKIGAFLVTMFLCFAWHVKDKREGVQEAVERTTSVLNQKYDKALVEASAKALRASKDLQANADKDRETKDEKIEALNTSLTTALSKLRTRPTRPSDIANNPPSVEACTARELYREDAEFLTREAARAESVLIERDYYYEQYEAVRKKINGTTD
jgi:LPS O-antigen subunit length determinant protein (WzzB/FepE family)